MSTSSLTIASDADLTSAVELELAGFFQHHTATAEAYGPEFQRLWHLASDGILGGKLVRPTLFLGAYRALAGDADSGAAVRISASIELLHYSFLLHDDVIDGDYFRRHRPNLIGALVSDHPPLRSHHEVHRHPPQRLHWARSGGILMGDLVLSAVHQRFAREDLPHDVRLRLLDLLEHTITESVAGQQVDVGLTDEVISPQLDTVLRMCALKTGTYTFEMPLRAAAILAAASPELEATLGQAGHHLGLAFQLQDDLISTFVDASEHGKDPFSDLREGKQTALIAHARTTPYWPRIEPRLGAADFHFDDGIMIRSLLTEGGSREFVQAMVTDQMNACFTLLRSADAPDPMVVFLRRLTASLEDRQA